MLGKRIRFRYLRAMQLSLKRMAKQATLRLFPRDSGFEAELGDFLLRSAAELSERVGGDVSALSRSGLRAVLANKGLIKQASEALQFLQTAFEPDYTSHLFPYYQQQQYVLLLAFLSYPLRGPGCLGPYTEPHHAAAELISGPLDVLDYGAGIPFGAIDLIRSRPGKVRSITVVDLDLIHTRLSEHVLVELLGREGVHFVRTTDADAIPKLRGPFNFSFGKDIFEHLNDPISHLRNILGETANHAVCYFDFTDHGERYLQHVTPTLSPLAKELTAWNFEAIGQVRGMSGFARYS
jgi:hypothetical protein